MAAEDIHARVLGWALDEAGKACFGEEYGVSVSWAAQAAQTPQGVVLAPVWMLLLTAKSPLLGEGPMYHLVPLGSPLPLEDFTRKQVTDGIAALRALASRKLAPSNGHSKALAGR